MKTLFLESMLSVTRISQICSLLTMLVYFIFARPRNITKLRAELLHSSLHIWLTQHSISPLNCFALHSIVAHCTVLQSLIKLPTSKFSHQATYIQNGTVQAFTEIVSNKPVKMLVWCSVNPNNSASRIQKYFLTTLEQRNHKVIEPMVSKASAWIPLTFILLQNTLALISVSWRQNGKKSGWCHGTGYNCSLSRAPLK